MDLLRAAVSTYACGPVLESDEAQVQYMNHALYSILSGDNLAIDNMVVTSDPGEDSDDILMIKYILSRVSSSSSKVYVIISGGALSPDERFAHLKHIFPEFEGAQWGIQFNNIIFLQDGVQFTQPIQCFVNCGPCHSVTLRSIFERLNESRGRMITVGANADGTAAGINQKQTDDGVLKDLEWNKCLATLKDVSIKNLDVGVSRYVLLPHPSRITGPYSSMPAECFDDIVYTTGMFFASRPSPKHLPPKIVLRINEGNSIVVSQHIDVMAYEGTAEFAYGLELIYKYGELCPTHEIAASAAIPLMATALMGGVYKEGIFGFDPKDKMARQMVSCLTPDSARVFISKIRTLERFTPGYDLLAIILASQIQ